MKKALVLLLAIFILPVVHAENVTLYFFYGQGCPHCAAAEPFLNELEQKYLELKIQKYEVYFNESNRQLFDKFAAACGSEVQGVPTFFIGDRMIVGYSKETAQQIEAEIQKCMSTGTCKDLKKHLACTKHTEKSGTSPLAHAEDSSVTLPTLIGAAAVDAINPCTLAILLILLTTILIAGSKLRVLGAGLAFTSAIYISYFLMGLGIYSAVQISGLAHLFYYVVIFIAILVGLLSIKDWFIYKPGAWAVEIPASWRPVVKKLLSSVTSIPGAALVGLFCSFFLLPCSSGPYLVVLGMLAKAATRALAIRLLLLYNLIFVLPMIGITLAVYAGTAKVESISKWREKNIKLLHLISGIIMLGLAGLLAISIWLGWV